MDKQLFQARDVDTDVVAEFQAASKTARARTYGQFFEHIWAFYKAHGGLETQISSSMERPPTHRRVGASMKDSEEQSGTIVTDGRRKNSGARARKRTTINPSQRPKGEKR